MASLLSSLQLGLAVGAIVSEGFARGIADSERWVWIVAVVIALVAMACMVRVAIANVLEARAARRVPECHETANEARRR
jgi:hypothetical protein